MEEVTIRPAVLQDLEVLLDFEQQLISAERPMDVTIKPPPVTYYDLPALITRNDIEMLVAETGNQIVGCGYACAREARAYLDHEQYAYLGFMYTRPDYRGKGVNSKIMEALFKWAGRQGLNEIRLTVYHNNNEAIRAYQKVGFGSHILEMRLVADHEAVRGTSP